MGCGCRESKPAPPPEVKHAVKVQREEATPVGSTLQAKASEELAEQVEEELALPDPPHDVAAATLSPQGGGGLGEPHE